MIEGTPHPPRPSRRCPARMPLVEAGNQTPIVFLTVCAKSRKTLFANPEAHALLVEAWRRARRWLVGRYVILPDHLHLFCASADFPPKEDVRAWVRYWKSVVSRQWPSPEEQPIWQADAWDTQLRRGESYAGKWEYVRDNPVRAGLVADSDQWPFQGELNVLPWHDA